MYLWIMGRNIGRYKNMAPIGEVFEELLAAYNLKDRFEERKVLNAWGELMGNTVAKRTTELSVKNKKLYVKVSSGPLKNELLMNKSRILQLIADKFGKDKIIDIAFL